MSFILFISIFTVLFVSPKPFLWLLDKQIPEMPNYSPPINFGEIENSVETKKNMAYDSNYSNSYYDIYLPKGNKSPSIIVFFHGGGFISGDKKMAEYLGPTLAANGYAVLAVNYELAPQSTLDQQLSQVTEFVNDIPNIAKTFNLNSDTIFLSGSSAGAYLAAQLCTVKYNADYQKLFKQAIDKEINIKGLVLYSSPFQLSFAQKQRSDNMLVNLGIFETGWALTDERFWRSDPQLRKKYDLDNYVTSQFPPVFLTDGNTKTFTDQAIEYKKRLEEENVTVTSLFFDNQINVGHGYQMVMDTPQSEEAITKTLFFLKENQEQAN